MNLLSPLQTKMRTLHDSFYWEVMWGMLGHEPFTLERTILKYWHYVNFTFPIRGIPLDKASMIIRIALIKEGCRLTGIPYSLEIVKSSPFYKDNCGNWLNYKKYIIYLKELDMAKIILKKKGKGTTTDKAPAKATNGDTKNKSVKSTYTATKSSVAIIPKPTRKTTAFLGRCTALDMLLKRKHTDAEIIAEVKEATGYNLDDHRMSWLRTCLNRGSFVEYGQLYTAQEDPVAQIATSKANKKAPAKSKSKSNPKAKKPKLTLKKKK